MTAQPIAAPPSRMPTAETTVNVGTADLQTALRNAAQVLPSRPAISILACVQLELTPGQLAIYCNDYDSTLQQSVPVDYDGPKVEACIGGRLLAASIRLHDSGVEDMTAVTFRPKGLTVEQGDMKMRLPGLEPADYPDRLRVPVGRLSIPGRLLGDVVSRVSVAAGRDDTLPVLTGVHVTFAENRLTFAATDRYRLTVLEAEVSGQVSGDVKTALICARTLALVARLFKDAPTVRADIFRGPAGEERVSFALGSTVLTARLVEGQFPDYSKLLPTPEKAGDVAVVDRKALIRACRYLQVAQPPTSPVRLSWAPGGRLVIRTGLDDSAEVSGEVKVDSEYAGPAFDMALNPSYLLAALRAIKNDEVTIRFASRVQGEDPTQTFARKPIVVADADEPAYSHLLMPVRMSN